MSKTMENELTNYRVCEINTETAKVKTLKLTLEDGSTPSYTPGQFITVFHPNSNLSEGKAYSISSAPHEPTLDITVKAVGEFSNMLCEKKIDDSILGSLPYGYFFSESSDTPIIMLAGGIGITPLFSMIKHYTQQPLKRPIKLFYSNQTIGNIVFLEHLNKTKQNNSKLEFNNFITRENNLESYYIGRRMCAQDILDNLISPNKNEFFICGSISFVRDLWNQLVANGVSEEQIFTESFY
jgi:ferredoxin-NADP reductase